jgi:hypothetical protein
MGINIDPNSKRSVIRNYLNSFDQTKMLFMTFKEIGQATGIQRGLVDSAMRDFSTAGALKMTRIGQRGRACCKYEITFPAWHGYTIADDLRNSMLDIYESGKSVLIRAIEILKRDGKKITPTNKEGVFEFEMEEITFRRLILLANTALYHAGVSMRLEPDRMSHVGI